MQKFLVATLFGMALWGFGCGGDSGSKECVANWEDDESFCPPEASVSCDQATSCFVTIEACEASGECD